MTERVFRAAEKPLDLEEIERSIALWSGTGKMVLAEIEWRLRALIGRVRELEVLVDALLVADPSAGEIAMMDRIKELEAKIARLSPRPSGCGCQIDDHDETILSWCLFHADIRNALKATIDKVRDESVALQKHRDSWRDYCYGKREKPQDFTDGNLVDRPQTKIEKLEAENNLLKGALAADDERLRKAESRIWRDGSTFGCDAPERMADYVEELLRANTDADAGLVEYLDRIKELEAELAEAHAAAWNQVGGFVQEIARLSAALKVKDQLLDVVEAEASSCMWCAVVLNDDAEHYSSCAWLAARKAGNE